MERIANLSLPSCQLFSKPQDVEHQKTNGTLFKRVALTSLCILVGVVFFATLPFVIAAIFTAVVTGACIFEFLDFCCRSDDKPRRTVVYHTNPPVAYPSERGYIPQRAGQHGGIPGAPTRRQDYHQEPPIVRTTSTHFPPRRAGDSGGMPGAPTLGGHSHSRHQRRPSFDGGPVFHPEPPVVRTTSANFPQRRAGDHSSGMPGQPHLPPGLPQSRVGGRRAGDDSVIPGTPF